MHLAQPTWFGKPMAKQLVIIDGHPDPDPQRFCHALVAAYAKGARSAGHEVRIVTISKLDLPLLRSAGDWESGSLPASLDDAQEAIGWAHHLVFIYPLWLGSMPALLKGFLEQILRPGFAIKFGGRTLRPGLLKGNRRVSWSRWECRRSCIAGILARTV
jgi:putative NADPH-quinone reductase